MDDDCPWFVVDRERHGAARNRRDAEQPEQIEIAEKLTPVVPAFSIAGCLAFFEAPALQPRRRTPPSGEEEEAQLFLTPDSAGVLFCGKLFLIVLPCRASGLACT